MVDPRFCSILHHTHRPRTTITDMVTMKQVTTVMPAVAPTERQLSSFRFSGVISTIPSIVVHRYSQNSPSTMVLSLPLRMALAQYSYVVDSKIRSSSMNTVSESLKLCVELCI